MLVKIATNIIDKMTKQSYGALLFIWFGIALFFALLYLLLLIFIPNHAPKNIDLNSSLISKTGNVLYYSIITATSTGYGDIVPQGFSKVLASMQSFIALVVFAVFVMKLVSLKQELALQEVHKLTFEDVFHNVREGLYIIRKDCDRFIKMSKKPRDLTQDEWDDLIVLYKHAQSLFQEIPQFYADNKKQLGFYTLDDDRETLLHEAVVRTLLRIEQMILSFEKAKINWRKNRKCNQELLKLYELVEFLVPEWEKSSPYNRKFEDIIKINNRLKKVAKTAKNSN